ncbi:MAG: type II toxin-antitoxin system RelE/ParE family toxin [Arenimonas sp.]|nr:type II toxin-antitoxin system RelE/ParE family toxin [Arenimonas sp.]
MTRILWSSKARSDVSDIWRWLAETASPAIADDKLDRIAERVSALAAHPMLGPVRRDIAEKARMLVCDRWLVLYLITDDGNVHIVRVVDAARDPATSRTDFNAPRRGSS